MTNRTNRFLLSTTTILLLFTIPGCNGLTFVWDREDRENVDLGVAPLEEPYADSAARKNTIGAVTYYQGTGPMRVRGYGLVLGLGENGSRECPDYVFQNLVQGMYKQHTFTETQVGVKSMTPEQLISSTDTAAVAVTAEIPAGSVAGTPIDVMVRALPGTQTESLAGGRLFPMELEIFAEIPERGSISGRTLAQARGPLFINPFAGGESATASNPREGIILGGGQTTIDRHVRLVLISPSYQLAKRIQDRLNTRFPSSTKVADAVSPSFVKITVPPEYYHDSAHFLALLRSVYLSRNPNFESVTARKLAREITRPDAPHAEISLCFEAIGKKSLPILKELYTHEQDYVSFHAAAAGIRLGEHLAADVMSAHAGNPQSEFRYQAIRALAVASDIGSAGMALRRLLEDDDHRVAIAAYEALLQRKDSTIHSVRIGRSSFVLDLVPSNTNSTIYCKRTGKQRIALFGQQLALEPPLFYTAPDSSLVLNADLNASSISAIRKAVKTGRTSPIYQLPLELPKFIQLCGNSAGVDLENELTGLGLDYGAIVRTLHQLCADGAISARFMLEQPNLDELFGPTRPAGRPESDL